MKRGNCERCEEQDPYYISNDGDALCNTCYIITIKEEREKKWLK